MHDGVDVILRDRAIVDRRLDGALGHEDDVLVPEPERVSELVPEDALEVAAAGRRGERGVGDKEFPRAASIAWEEGHREVRGVRWRGAHVEVHGGGGVAG